MPYQTLSDIVVLVHFLFIVFVLLGGLLALRWRWMPWVHVPSAVWGAVIELCGWICPLTPLEQWLRQAGGERAFSGGFVEHYILPIVYPAGLARPIQIALGVVVVALNLAIYGLVLRRRGRARGGRPARRRG